MEALKQALSLLALLALMAAVLAVALIGCYAGLVVPILTYLY